MPTIAYPHIEVSREGVPVVVGTTTKVVEIVLDRLAHHWDADEIQRQHPHLSLAQIHSALAYYYDHQSEIDHDIQQRLAEAESLRAEHSNAALAARLRHARSNRTTR